MDEYYFISDVGETSLPSKDELTTFSENGENVLLVLDSCVCLDIVNMISKKHENKIDNSKILNLIEYAQENNINQLPIYALIELCYNRNTFEIQAEKLFDFLNKIDFAFLQPVEQIKKYDYNFDLSNFSAPNINNQILYTLIDERVNIFYAGLLKICEISQKGLRNNLAEKNILEFLDWMVNDLDIILGIEYSLALSIFGGDSNFRTMLKLGTSKDKILKATWATAWDLFHAKVSCNRKQMSFLVNEKVYPIFVTKDKNLFELISPKVDSYIRYESTRLSLIEKNIPSCYSHEFMQNMNKRLIELNLKRLIKNTNRSVDSEKIKLIIKKIENNLNP